MARQYMIGAEDIVGDDVLGYEDILGADIRLAPTPGSPGGSRVRMRPPTRGREMPLGFTSVAAIAAGAAAIVSTQPQVVMRMDRLVVPATIAAFFDINDVKVGTASELASAVAVPAEVFTQGAFGVRLKGDTAQISQQVSISVTNTDVAAHIFKAAIIGPAVL